MSSRRIRFSLRTVLLLLAVLSVGIAVPVNRARHQQRVVEQIEAMGQLTHGRVIYRHQWPVGGMMNPNAAPLGPKWLREAIGDHYFHEVRVIWVRADEKLLAEIAKLRGVEELSIDASILTDEDSLRYLARASDLNSLKIERGLKLSRLNLVHLRDVPTLRTLTLSGLKVGDEEIHQLAAIEQLERLTIEQTLVTQEGVDRLQASRPDLEIEFALRVISPSLFPYIEGGD